MATRRERVILELQDDFSPGMLKAAAATKILDRELNDLSGQAVKSRSATRDIDRNVSSMGSSTETAGKQIDKLSGRLQIFAEAAAILGPGLAPIGAVAVPAVSGLASQLGFAALAGGTMVAAFQGVGDALKAVNKAGVEPTAANLQAARLAMAQISPEAQQFVRELQSMGPALKSLRDTAAAGLFPGFTEGLDALLTRLPDVQRIVGAVAGELGDIGASAGKSLASARWDDFFMFLENEAPKALADMAAAVGNVGHALAELWIAFQPLNNDFGSWLVNSTAGLDRWASSLSRTQGFQEFIDYVRSTGPQVEATFGAIGNAVLQIVEAASPLGGPVLAGLEAFANAIAAVADSDLGTPIFTALAALSLYNRALATTASLSKASFGNSGVVTSLKQQRTSLQGMVADFKGAAVAQREVTAVQREAAVITAGYNGQLQARNRSLAAGLPKSVEGEKRLATSLARVQDAHARVGEAEERAAKAGQARSRVMRETAASAGKAGAAVAALAVVTTGAADGLGLTNTATLGLAGSMAGPYGAAIGTAVGATLDLAHANDTLKGSLTAALASAKTGDIDELTAAYKRASAASQSTFGFDLNSTSVSLSQAFDINPVRNLNVVISALNGSLSKYRAQLASIEGAVNAGGALGGAESLLKSQNLLAAGFGLTGRAARQSAAAIAANREAAATTAGQFTAFGQSLDDSKVSLNSWIQDMQASADALNNFASNAIRAGNRGLRDGLIRQLQEAGPAGALRMKQLANGTEAQINRANRAFGAGQRAVRNYTDAIGGVPRTKSTTINEKGAAQGRVRIAAFNAEIRRIQNKIAKISESGAPGAKAQVAGLNAEIKRIKDKIAHIRQQGAEGATAQARALASAINAISNKTVTLTTVRRTFNIDGKGPVASGVGASADGTTVPKTGRGYADRHLYLLADGEEVISNRYGQADRNRGLLKAINRNQLALGGTVGALAAGGTASNPVTGGTSISVVFPSPAVLKASVTAAEQIAVYSARTSRSARDTLAANTDDLRARVQIRDIERSLTERATKNVTFKDKKGKKRSRKVDAGLALTGLDREAAVAELAQAKADLAATRAQAAYDLRAKRAEAAATLTAPGDVFGRGTSAASALTSVNRQIAAITEYGGIIARLKAAGASPALLAQVDAKAQAGDFRAATLLGKSLLASPVMLGQVNASLSKLSNVSASVAAVTTDPRFSSSTAWNPKGLVPTLGDNSRTVNVAVTPDMSAFQVEIARLIKHEVGVAMNSSVA